MRAEIIREAVLDITNHMLEEWQLHDDMHLSIYGEKILLKPWRFDRRFLALRTLAVEDNVLRQICSYKSLIVGSCDDDLRKTIFQELDICEWLLDDRIVSVYAQKSGENIVSMIVRTQKNILCNIETALTLSEDTPPVIKHEIVGKEGMISDRSINEQIPVDAVYIFEKTKKSPQTFTDMDPRMLGLTPGEVKIADNIAAWIRNKPDIAQLKKDFERMNALVDIVFDSISTGDVIVAEAAV